MKNRTLVNVMLICITLVFYQLLTSCHKKSNNGPSEISVVSESPLQIGYTGGEYTIKFVADKDWTLSSDASWITFLDGVSGTGNAILKFKASENETTGIRNGKITITSKGTSKVIDVSQVKKSTFINFKHPSILYTAEELLSLKETINNNSSPSATTTYNNLMRRCNSALSYTTTPYIGSDPSVFIEATYIPASFSRDLAMAYWFTGDKKYALKSIELIRDWAIKTKNNKYTGDAGNSMYLTRGMFPMVCAYDMLVNENIMDTETKTIIGEWFRTIYKEAVIDVKLWEDQDYFSKQYFQNHLVAHSMGMIIVGLALEDESMVQLGLNSPDNPKDIYELIVGCIFMPGDAFCSRERINALPVEKGQIYDRYRHQTGPMKGLQYSHLTQTLLTTVGRMCYNNGIDLFSYTAPTGESLLLPFEYYSDFYRTKDACIKSGYFCGETDRLGQAGDNPGMYELGLRYYPNSKPIKDLMQSGVFNREAAYMELLGFTRFFSVPVDK